MNDELTRRELLALGLAIPPLGLALARAEPFLDTVGASAAPLQATPSCDDGDDPTPELTEGPYFSSGSPRRRSLLGSGVSGTRLTITGYVRPGPLHRTHEAHPRQGAGTRA